MSQREAVERGRESSSPEESEKIPCVIWKTALKFFASVIFVMVVSKHGLKTQFSVYSSDRRFTLKTAIRLPSVLLSLALIFLSPVSGFANRWTGAAGTDKWSHGSNWLEGMPSNDATFDAAAGGGGAVIDIDIDGGVASLNTLWFSTADADAYTIGQAGDTVALAERWGNIWVYDSVVRSQTIAANILLGTGANEASYNIISDSAGAQLTISGNITGGSSGGSSAQTVKFGGAGNTVVSGVIAAGGGVLTLNKTGTGTLTLSGANTYTGGTTIYAGTLRATTNAEALGAGSISMEGGTLSLANDTGLDFGRDVTLTGNATINSDRLAGGAGVEHTLGSLSMGVQTLTLGIGALANAGTQKLTFGTVELSGNATIDARDGAGASGALLTLASVTGAGQNFTIADTSTADVAISGLTTTAGGNNQNGGNVSIKTTGDISTGAITTSGGADTSNDGGHNAGSVMLNSTSGSVTTGNIVANGSSSTGAAYSGSGANVAITAETTMTTGSITTRGGSDSGDGGGGSGGNVTITGGAGNTIGAIDTRAGDGNWYLPGDSGSVTINVTSATMETITTTGGGCVMNCGGSKGGDVTFNGGVVDVASITTKGGMGTASDSGGAGGIVTVNAGTVTVSGNIDTSGGASASGSDGAAGKIDVNAGSLVLTNGATTNSILSPSTIAIAGNAELDTRGLQNGGITLSNGQTLTGSGTVTGGLTVGSGSTLSPGDSPGTITTDGNAT
ncbi:MAG TPA: autotransporter-associated beta strand repeat-containing protein, partial [Candidatus Omnitrophota bacterium]|nr:autotransporter-associated beta strand repeat-containing protein [Candidatus Omnitrophota bacterium]